MYGIQSARRTTDASLKNHISNRHTARPCSSLSDLQVIPVWLAWERRIIIIAIIGLLCYTCLMKIEYENLQGRVKFPIGGIVRERVSAGAKARDLVKFQDRQ